jgi:hypothetical protein
MGIEKRHERRQIAAGMLRDMAANADGPGDRASYRRKAVLMDGCIRITLEDGAEVAYASIQIATLLSLDGNPADEHAADYARFAVLYGLDPDRVSDWGHLATAEAEEPLRWLSRKKIQRAMKRETQPPEVCPGTYDHLNRLTARSSV